MVEYRRILTTEDGAPILTEDGRYLTTEGIDPFPSPVNDIGITLMGNVVDLRRLRYCGITRPGPPVKWYVEEADGSLTYYGDDGVGYQAAYRALCDLTDQEALVPLLLLATEDNQVILTEDGRPIALEAEAQVIGALIV